MNVTAYNPLSHIVGASPRPSLRLALVLLFALLNGAVDAFLLYSSNHGSATQSFHSWAPEYAAVFWPYGVSLLLVATGRRSFAAFAAGTALSAALIALTLSAALVMGWFVALLTGHGVALLLWLLSHVLVAKSSALLMKKLPDQRRYILAGIFLVMASVAILVAVDNAKNPFNAP